MKKPQTKPSAANIWRGSHELRGIKSRLTTAIKQCQDGAYVILDLKTAQNLAEVCDQAIHTEKGHGV